jgi:hypothetical protein
MDFERTMITNSSTCTSFRFIPLKSLVIYCILFLATTSVHSFTATIAKVTAQNNKRKSELVQSKSTYSQAAFTVMSSTCPPGTNGIPYRDLPGDPSLILTTNVDLGAAKVDVMKGTKKMFKHYTYLFP